MKLIAIGAVGILGLVLLVVFLRPNNPLDETSSDTATEERRSERAVSDVENKSPLVSVYDGIRVSTDTTVLDVSGRGLTGSLKAEIRQLSRLRELDLGDNQFTGLPAEIGQLRELEILNLSNNPLTGLPHELGNLANLKVLDLSGTNYSEFDLEVIAERLPASVTIITEAVPEATSTETFIIQGRTPN